MLAEAKSCPGQLCTFLPGVAVCVCGLAHSVAHSDQRLARQEALGDPVPQSLIVFILNVEEE
jgi:hypothetical protein